MQKIQPFFFGWPIPPKFSLNISFAFFCATLRWTLLTELQGSHIVTDISWPMTMKCDFQSVRLYTYVRFYSYRNSSWTHNCICKWSTLLCICQIVSIIQNSRNAVCDMPRCGRPCSSYTTENVDRIRELVHSNPRLFASSISEEVGTSKGTVIHSTLPSQNLATEEAP